MVRYIFFFLAFLLIAGTCSAQEQPVYTPYVSFYPPPFDFTDTVTVRILSNTSGGFTYFLPATWGTAGQVLSTNGLSSDTLRWITPSGGSGTIYGVSPIVINGGDTVTIGADSTHNILNQKNALQTGSLRINGSASTGGNDTAAAFVMRGAAAGGAAFSATGVLASVSQSNGQVLIGNSGGIPTAATITPGAGINITNSPGGITVSATADSTGSFIQNQNAGPQTPGVFYIKDTGAITSRFTAGGIITDQSSTTTNLENDALLLNSEGANTGTNAVNVALNVSAGGGTNNIDILGDSWYIDNHGTLTLGTPLTAPNGGTGLSTLTAHDVLVGNGTGSVTLISPTTNTGYVLTSNGTGFDPTFQAVSGGSSYWFPGAATGSIVDSGSGNYTAQPYSILAGLNDTAHSDGSTGGSAVFGNGNYSYMLGSFIAGSYNFAEDNSEGGNSGIIGTFDTVYSPASFVTGIYNMDGYFGGSGEYDFVGGRNNKQNNGGSGSIFMFGTNNVNGGNQGNIILGQSVNDYSSSNNFLYGDGSAPLLDTLGGGGGGGAPGNQFIVRVSNGYVLFDDTSQTVPVLAMRNDSILFDNNPISDATGHIIVNSLIPGTNGYVLTSTSGGVSWQPASGGGATQPFDSLDVGSNSFTIGANNGAISGDLTVGGNLILPNNPLSVANGGTGNVLFNGYDIITGGGSGTAPLSFIPPGTNGQLLQSAGSLTQATFTTNTYPSTDAEGDILYASAANTIVGLGIGATGTVLQPVSGLPAWTATEQLGVVSTTTGSLALANSSSSHLTTLQAGNATAAVTYTLPTAAPGAAGDMLVSTTTGGMSWAVPPSGTGTVTSVDVAIPGMTSSGAITTSGTISMSGTLNVANGGTGAATLTSKGVLYGNGTSAVGITAAGNNGQFLGTVSGATPQYTNTLSSLGTANTAYDGFELRDSLAALAGAQAYSPSVHWNGSGWKTTATAGPEAVDMIAYLTPVQGSTTPTDAMVIASSVNGSGYVQVASLGMGGVSNADPYFNLGTGTITSTTPGYWIGGAQVLTSGTLGTSVLASSLTSVGSTLSSVATGLAASQTSGFTSTNSTAATVGTTEQFPAAFKEQGTAWKSNTTAASQTDIGLLQFQPLTGATVTTGQWVFYSNINAAGLVANLTIASNGNLTIGNHLLGTTAIGSASDDGTGVTSASVAGNDLDGVVTLTTALNAGGGNATITFGTTYTTAPVVTLTPSNATGGAEAIAGSYYVTSTATTFVINFATTTAKSGCTFNYHVHN